jgi:glycosyltransferase involved in cell wall biosynthesis
LHLTVITPSFNSAAFFGDCIKSVKSASADSLAICAIDNCSTDSTLDSLLAFSSPKVVFSYLSQKDSGPAQALNTGFKQLALEDLLWILLAGLILMIAMHLVLLTGR